MSYSIWMVPKEVEVKEYFSKMVKDLADKNGGPEFEPHITLLADVLKPLEEVEAACVNLAKKMKPLVVETGMVEYSTTYYQCVFVRIKPRPELMELYDLAKEEFGLTKPTVFMPHMSLFYGEIPYVDRERMVRSFTLEPQKFILESLIITGGGENPPSEWKHLFEVKFSKDD